jgi:hypothetical protein
MELFAIALSVPAGLVLGLIYANIASRIVPQYKLLSKFFIVASCIVLSALILEILLLVTLGAINSRGMFGPAFSIMHLIVFMFGAPAVANILTLPQRVRFRGYRLVAGVAFGILFASLVVMQYVVSEELYGIDGDTGPFSAVIQSNHVG